jgi:hypothetical protein
MHNTKADVFEANPWTDWERVLQCVDIKFWSYWHGGKLPGLGEDVLAWEGHKLFIELAPEPNDVDWEFIHCSTAAKLKVPI